MAWLAVGFTVGSARKKAHPEAQGLGGLSLFSVGTDSGPGLFFGHAKSWVKFVMFRLLSLLDLVHYYS